MAPEALEGAQESGTKRSPAAAEVEVPESSGDELLIATGDGPALSITLPQSGQPAEAESTDFGLSTFDHGDGATTVPVPKEDGSVQILTVITDADAPDSYTYTLGDEAVASLFPLDNGGVALLDSAGDLVGGIAPPWALDADDSPVPTRFVINGLEVTQIVDHNSGNWAYPIVADPWFGKDLTIRREVSLRLREQVRV